MKKILVLMFLLTPTYGEDTVDSTMRKLLKGEYKSMEITNDKYDWKLCFKCKVCKTKRFQRFYIRFIQTTKREQKNVKKK